MNSRNIKLSTMLTSAFVLVCAIAALVNGSGINGMEKIGENSDVGYRFDLVGLNLTQEAEDEIILAGVPLRSAILAASPEQRAAFMAEAAKFLASDRGNLDKAEPVVYTEEGTKVFVDFNQSWQDFSQAFKEMKDRINSPLENRDHLISYLFGDYHQKTLKTHDPMSTLVDLRLRNAQEAAKSNQALFDDSRYLMVVLVVLSVLLGVGIGARMTRSFTRQLGTDPATAADLAQSVAASDLDVSIDLRPADTSSLMESLKVMRDALSRVVSEVRENAEGVATASAHLADPHRVGFFLRMANHTSAVDVARCPKESSADGNERICR